jgi:uncharacterized membrane protein
MYPAFTPVILVHLLAALAAMVLGGAIFLARKGTPTHRGLGRAWVALMLVTAISTWWIRSDGQFSWIHGLSVLSLATLTAGVAFAIAGKIALHLKLMRGLYFGALVVAGLFTLLPQRLLGRFVWSSLGLL